MTCTNVLYTVANNCAEVSSDSGSSGSSSTSTPSSDDSTSSTSSTKANYISISIIMIITCLVYIFWEKIMKNEINTWKNNNIYIYIYK